MTQPAGELERLPFALATPNRESPPAIAVDSPNTFGFPDDASSPPDDALEVSPGKVARALRRRWIVALAIGLLGAAAAGYAADQFVGTGYTVRAQVYIPTDRPGFGFGGQDNRIDAATYQRRQSAQVRSRAVLHSALQRPGISDLAIVRTKADPVGWLERDLLVDFGSAQDIMRVSLKGAPPEELITLLNAVAEAFLLEGVNRDLTEKTAYLRYLRQRMTEEQGRLESARSAVGEKAGQFNSADLATVRHQHELDRTRLFYLQTQRFDLDSQQKRLRQTREELLAAPPLPTVEPSIRPADLKAETDLANCFESSGCRRQ